MSFDCIWVEDPKSEAEWAKIIGEQIWPGQGRTIGNCRILLVAQGHDVKAVFAFHNYDPAAGVIEISGASSGFWMTSQTLYEIYNYPFNLLKCQMVVQRNDPDNHKLNRQMRRFGFNEYRIPRLRGRNKDELVFTLTEEAWRRHPATRKVENGQVIPSQAAVS